MNRPSFPFFVVLLSLALIVPLFADTPERPSTSAVLVPAEKTPTGVYEAPSGPRLIGDTIEQPFLVPQIPFIIQGSTCGFAHDYDEMCPYGGNEGPDVVYAYTATISRNVNIDLCRSWYDTKVYVYKDGFTPGVPYACNDDACGVDGYRSEILFVDFEAGHTYYIVVDAYSYECGDYDLRIYDSWECPIPCPPDALLEGEMVCHDGYDDRFNSGCGGTPPVFWTVEPSPDPIVICGESGTYFSDGLPMRDTDWYEIVTDYAHQLSVQCDAEFSVSLMLLQALPDCNQYDILESKQPGFCEPAWFVQAIGPGRYWIWVAPQAWYDVECGATYTLTIDGHELNPTAVSGAVPGPAPSLRTSPNPFNPSVTIAFDLQRPGEIRLTAHGPDGRFVEEVAAGSFAHGPHEVLWTGHASNGRPAGPGVYFIRLQTEEGVSTAKVVLLE